jgi:hypothetical protein
MSMEGPMSYVRRDHIEAESTGVVPLEAGVPAQTVARRTTLTRSFSIPAVLAGVASIILIVVGAVAIARTDLDEPLAEPIVEVAGFAHNAVLGIVEVVAGVLLLLAAISRSRGAIMLMSIVIGVAAVIALIEPTVGGDEMPIDRGFAAIVAIVAGVLLAAAVLTPSVNRTTEVVDRPVV